MSTPPMPEEEPLKNVELESAILGLRMALTPEEETEARQEFLKQLSLSTIVVPTTNPVQLAPDGSIAPGTDITFVVVENKDGVTGVPGFTALKVLRSTLPNVNNGLFLNGAQIAGMVAASPHVLFVDGPDMHAEIDRDELASVVESAQKIATAQQAAAQRNELLETALSAMASNDSDTARETTTAAFLNGFCRIPVAGDSDKGAQCIVMRAGNPQDTNAQEIPLMTEENELLCFTSDEAMRKWQDVDRNSVALPGPMIVDMISKTGIGRLIVNRGTESARSFRVEQTRLTVI